MGLLDNRVALISGVGAGLGRDTALLFAREGAALFLLARKREVTEAIGEEVRALGAKCVTFAGDILNADDCARTVAAVLASLGRIDALVNVAYKGDRDIRRSLLEADPDLGLWRESFDVNVFGTMKITKAVAHHMCERRQGHIIMVNSMTAERVQPNSYAYSGSKAALQKITQVLALELGAYGIRVNSIHPGYMWGTQTGETIKKLAAKNKITPEEQKARIEAEIPLGYIPPTSEYASTILYLASELSRPVTGQSIHVNGGHYMR